MTWRASLWRELLGTAYKVGRKVFGRWRYRVEGRNQDHDPDKYRILFRVTFSFPAHRLDVRGKRCARKHK